MLHKVDKIDYIKICADRIKETLKHKEVEDSTLLLFKEPIEKYHTLNYEVKRKSLGGAINKLDSTRN